MSCSSSWNAELSGESKNEVNAREVNTPVSWVTVNFGSGGDGGGDNAELESPGLDDGDDGR